MRNQFDYYGLDTTQRRNLQKNFHDEYALPAFGELHGLIKELWAKPQRELQYFAMELYEKYRKELTPKDVEVFEFMITQKSWWDTVDFIAPKLIAALHLQHPELAEANCTRWIKSKNIWLIRAALIHQNLYKKRTDETLLFSNILQCAHHEDFFIRKGIGWCLRQYARTNPASVKKFVNANKNILAALSVKEAMKHL